MRYYAVIEKGEILEVMSSPMPLGYPDEAKIAHPEAVVREISEEDHAMVRSNLEWFTWGDNGKIHAKSPAERARIEAFKADWRRHHTLAGLQEDMADMEKRLRSVPPV